ncbi:MAG: class I SAM-dependent methyltransferase [Marinilabiliales bacterium]|nr:class I SAM-dependent methyltransferase [Marinilabiliales bacterium]
MNPPLPTMDYERAGTWDMDESPATGGQGIILELGTSLGISTLALALAAPERRVVTVEGCPALAAIARENLRNHGAANAEVLNMEFSAALDLLKSEGTEVSLAFIDGNHRGEALKQYAGNIRAMGEEMIIVADDIHMNRDMYMRGARWQLRIQRSQPSRMERWSASGSPGTPATPHIPNSASSSIAPASMGSLPLRVALLPPKPDTG